MPSMTPIWRSCHWISFSVYSRRQEEQSGAHISPNISSLPTGTAGPHRPDSAGLPRRQAASVAASSEARPLRPRKAAFATSAKLFFERIVHAGTDVVKTDNPRVKEAIK